MVPSQYERLVHAAASLIGTDLLSIDRDISDDEIANYLDANRDALDRAREALGPECSVPLRYEADFLQHHILTDLPALRCLAHSFAFELDQVRKHGGTDRAIEIGLNLLELANAVRRSGLVLDALASMPISGMAIGRLRRFRFDLTARSARQLAAELLQLDAQREEFADINARDGRWEEIVGHAESNAEGHEDVRIDFHAAQTWLIEEQGFNEAAAEEMMLMIEQLCELPSDEKQDMNSSLDNRALAELRLLAIEAALIAYHTQLGEYPSALAVLAPEFLTALPDDPFTGTEFRYALTNDGYLLYSPGPTGRDLGGRSGGWIKVCAGEADLFLDGDDHELDCCG